MQDGTGLTVNGITTVGVIGSTTVSTGTVPLTSVGTIKAAAGTSLSIPALGLTGSQQIGSNDASGSGTVSVAGNVALTGSNPIATVAGGVFTTAAGASAVTGGSLTVLGPTTVDLGGVGPIGVSNISGNLNVDGTAASPTFNFDLASVGTYDQINATGTLNLTGSNSPIINVALSSAPGSVIVPGTYQLITYATPNIGLAQTAFTLGTTPGGAGLTYQLLTTPTAVQLTIFGGTPTLVWDVNQSAGHATSPTTDGPGAWSQGSTNFFEVNPAVGPATWDNTQTVNVTFGGNSPAQAGGAVTLTGPIVSNGQLAFGTVTSPYTFSAAGPADTLTAAGGTLGGIVANNSTTITAPTLLAGSQAWTVVPSQTLTVATIGETGGSSGLTKAGTGTLDVIGPAGSTFSGGLTINDGTVTVGAANTLPTAGSVVLGTASDVILNLQSHNQTIGSLNGGGSTGGSVLLGTDPTKALTIAGNAATSYAGSISGSGGLDIQGSGSLTLAAPQLYTGATNISGGTLVATVAQTLPSGDVINLSGGTLMVTVPGALAGDTINITGAGMLDPTVAGALAGVTIHISNLGSFDPTILDAASNMVIDIDNGGTLGATTFSGTLSALGGSTINLNAGGTLILTNASALAGATVNINTGATLAPVVTDALKRGDRRRRRRHSRRRSDREHGRPELDPPVWIRHQHHWRRHHRRDRLPGPGRIDFRESGRRRHLHQNHHRRRHPHRCQHLHRQHHHQRRRPASRRRQHERHAGDRRQCRRQRQSRLRPLRCDHAHPVGQRLRFAHAARQRNPHGRQQQLLRRRHRRQRGNLAALAEPRHPQHGRLLPARRQRRRCVGQRQQRHAPRQPGATYVTGEFGQAAQASRAAAERS